MDVETKIFYKYKSCEGDFNDKNSDFYHLIDSLEKNIFILQDLKLLMIKTNVRFLMIIRLVMMR